MKIASIVFSAGWLFAAAGAVGWCQPLTITAVTCEGDVDPLGVDVPQPRLAWIIESPERGQRQSAYQVLAASAPAVLAQGRGDLWDTGKVVSDQTVDVAYRGQSLRPAQQVFWKVRVWDRRDRPSAWSPPATWTMGVIAGVEAGALSSGTVPPGWSARWITDPDLFRWRRPRLGYHSGDNVDTNTIKWVQLDLGQTRTIQSVQLEALRYDVIEGLGFPRRFKLELSDDPAFGTSTLVADFTKEDYPNTWARHIELTVRDVTSRYVRLTATRLRVEEGRACLALSQMEVISGGYNVAQRAMVTASDSLEQSPWAAAALTDGLGVPRANPRANDTLLLRREFAVRPGLHRALAYICGLGQYALTLNGARADDAVLSPGWTNYGKTCLYDTLDVTAQVRPGANAIGVCLAGGMYNVQEGRYVKFVSEFRPLTVISQLRLEYADGTVETVGTDDRWRIAAGPITFANMFGGEDYDARREPDGWDQPGFDDRAWSPAVACDGPGGILRGHSFAAPPIRTFESVKPVKVTQLRPGVTVYDLSQNAAIVPRLRVHGPAGGVVRIIPAELLSPDGAVDRQSCGARGPAWWQVTLKGGTGLPARESGTMGLKTHATENWSPDFFYHGCRYLQVECSAPAGAGLPEGGAPASNYVAGWDLPVVDSLEGVVVQSASPPVGEFACSNDLFNRIHTLVRWAQRSNMMSVMTDCPHRERLGWLEQNHLNGPALRYEFNLARLMAKSVNDMADDQQPDGLVPSIAPEYVIFSDGFRDSPEWGGACVLIPWQQYEWTGHVELLRRSYDLMKRYVAHLGSRADHQIVDFGLGDWYDIGPDRPGKAQLTPIALTATAFYFDAVRIVARVAALLDKPEEARQYEELADSIRSAFNQRFFDPAKGWYATGSQCADAIPLVMNLVEPERRAAVLAAIVKDVRDRGNALTAGDVGYRYLLRALADGGRSDVVFDLNNQTDKPGYGYQLKQGATALTEAWDAARHSSQNHFMLGQINEWFYHDLAGIQGDPAGPGFKRIIIRPAVVGDLTWVKAGYQSVRGRIASEWKRDRGHLTLSVTIPPGTTATIYVPARNAADVKEDGRAIARNSGIEFLRMDGDAAVFAVASGRYAFTSELPQTK